MNKSIFLIIIVSLNCLMSANARNRGISGDLGKNIGIGDEILQYVEKGTTIPDSGSTYIAIVDLKNRTINVTTRDKETRDSVTHYFIAGNAFKVWISAEVNWHEEEEAFHYSYQLESDTSSLTDIWFLSVEWIFDCQEIFGPPGWLTSDIYQWSNFRDSQKIRPGGKLSGFGLKSSCPPRLGKFSVRGDEIELASYGWNEGTWDIATEPPAQNWGIKGETIIPGPCPERIEPLGWIRKTRYALFKMQNLGYLDSKTSDEIGDLLIELNRSIMEHEEVTVELLESFVNDKLDELEPYRDRVEPEAWGFITENLKYMLRHIDLIYFK
jgi:hypothetical protein